MGDAAGGLKAWFGVRKNRNWVVFAVLAVVFVLALARAVQTPKYPHFLATMCFECRHRESREVPNGDFSQIKCNKCGGKVGELWKCWNCKFEFPLPPTSAGAKPVLEQYHTKCPNCGSESTRSLGAMEYLRMRGGIKERAKRTISCSHKLVRMKGHGHQRTNYRFPVSPIIRTEF